MREQILDIVFRQCMETGKEISSRVLLNPDAETKLYHSDGNLDSLGLVRFISGVEEKIEESFGKDILIADEKAMSRHSSPFISVGTLTDYILELMNEDEGSE